MSDILDWLIPPAEKAAQEAHIRKLVTEHAHNYGLIYETSKRCYCDECYEQREWLDKYYGDTGEWRQIAGFGR